MKIASSLKILLAVVALWANWELLAPYVAKDLPNTFAPLLFISHRIPTSSLDDPRYQKGYLDLVFIAYYIVFWSFIRQSITIYLCRPVARYFGIKRATKLDRFGEQGYAVIYFAVMGAWGVVCLHSLYDCTPAHAPFKSASCLSCRHGGTTPSTSGSVRTYSTLPHNVHLNDILQTTLTGI